MARPTYTSLVSPNNDEFSNQRRVFDLIATLISAENPDGSGWTLPINIEQLSVLTSSFIDRSGTISNGSTAQNLMSENLDRKYLLIQNISDTNLWINTNGVASIGGIGSILIMPNGAYEPAVIPTNQISIIGSITGKAFTAKEG